MGEVVDVEASAGTGTMTVGVAMEVDMGSRRRWGRSRWRRMRCWREVIVENAIVVEEKEVEKVIDRRRK